MSLSLCLCLIVLVVGGCRGVCTVCVRVDTDRILMGKACTMLIYSATLVCGKTGVWVNCAFSEHFVTPSYRPGGLNFSLEQVLFVFLIPRWKENLCSCPLSMMVAVKILMISPGPLRVAASFHSESMHRVSISSSCSSPKKEAVLTVKKNSAILNKAMTDRHARWSKKEWYSKSKPH